MSVEMPEPVENFDAIRLSLFTWPEVEDYLSNCKAIILPIGSTEQHGPTGAIGTDAFTAEVVSLEVGRLTGVLVAPTQPFGMAEHHLGFPGTMSLKPNTLLATLHDLFLSLAKHGFERIFVINGHGGNIATAKAAFAQAYSTVQSSRLEVGERFRCRLANWFVAKEVFCKAKELYGAKEGQHATPSEISITLHLYPCLLSKQIPLAEPAPAGPIYGPEDFRRRHPDGRMGSDPYLAKPSHGVSFIEEAKSALSKDLIEFINSP